MKKILIILSVIFYALNISAQSASDRPQEPKEPYPYNFEDVVFENLGANIKLAGTFTYPASGANFPAVILITGSGPQDRNEELLGHKPFLVISDYLTQQGIAVLRYDERGVGKSGGDFSSATTRDFATDAKAALDYLKTRKEVDASKIGFLGHSEGGTVAFMVAAEHKETAFIVSMAGGAMSGDSILVKQREMIFRASGVSDIVMAQNEEMVSKITDISEKYSTEEIIANLDKFVDDILPAYLRGNVEIRKQMGAQLIGFTSPWMHFFRKYDPATDLKKVECPILALNGDLDLQVEADSNLDIIKKTAKGTVTVKKYIDHNHLFQYCKTGSGLPQEYGAIKETISLRVLEDISEWILETTN